MSRLAKKPIKIPEKVEVEVNQGEVKAKGPAGKSKVEIPDFLAVEKKDGSLKVIKEKENRETKELAGTIYSLLTNLMIGASKGHKKTLIFKGIGYQAIAKKNKLELKLGYSHPIEIEAPEDSVEFEVDEDRIIVKGADKQKVGKFAAEIRKARPVDPYKQKGIKYEDEVVIEKEGKAVEKLEEGT